MSRKNVVAIALALAALPALAEDRGDTSVTALLTNVSATSSENSGTNVDAGFGLGFNYWLNPRWSTELQVSREETSFSTGVVQTPFPDGTVLVTVTGRTAASYPVDLLAQYHFVNATRWKPYLGFGAHYVERPSGLDSRPEFSSNDF